MKFLIICTVVTLVSKIEAYNSEGGLDITFIKESVRQAKQLVDKAYKDTGDRLKERMKRNALTVVDVLSVFKHPAAKSKSLIRAADYRDATLQVINNNLKSIFPGNVNASDMMTDEQKEILNQMTGCANQNLPQVCPRSNYRTITGECNNKKNPTLGSSNTGLKRNIPPAYEDRLFLPRGWTDSILINGFTLPKVRAVSNIVVSYADRSLTEDERRTQMFVNWGQFIDHDITLSPDTPAETTFFEGVDCNSNCAKAYPCFPIMIPENDTRIKNQSECIPLFRSAAVCNLVSPLREQINVLTAFHDGSQIYGSDKAVAFKLINTSSNLGLLNVNQNYTDDGRAYLPFDEVNGQMCFLSNKSAGIPCFLAGDVRVSEQLGLTTLQTLFLREHNRIVLKLHELNPHWCGEKLFQETRKIIGSMMQKITYKDWLYLLLGSKMSSVVPTYTYYDDTVDPRVSNVFTNAFRVGHSMVHPFLFRLAAGYQPHEIDPIIPLHHAFFAPWIMVTKGGMDPFMRGLLAKPAKMNRQDQIMSDELRERLFEMEMKIALDLASINMQRGRDHGLPGYCEWRRFCKLSVPRNEAELAKVLNNTVLAKKLIDLYGTPKNIDVWVGGVSEPPVIAGRVGEVLACLIGEQFTRTRDGDRFYYENDFVLTSAQKNSIDKVTLSSIICENTNITEVPINPFIVNKYPENFVPCSKIPKLDLCAWKDSCKSNADDVC